MDSIVYLSELGLDLCQSTELSDEKGWSHGSPTIEEGIVPISREGEALHNRIEQLPNELLGVRSW